MPSFNSYFLGLHVGKFLTKPLKCPIIAHCHLCLDMFEGEGLMHSDNMGLKNVFDRIFLKHSINNVFKTFYVYCL